MLTCRSAFCCAIPRLKLGHWLVAAVGGDELHISGDHPMLRDAEHEVVPSAGQLNGTRRIADVTWKLLSQVDEVDYVTAQSSNNNVH